jgi:hypothetical protein
MLSDIDGTDPYNVKNVLQHLQYNLVSFPPHLNFDDNMLSFMEDFIRNRIERVNSVGELKTTTRDETSEYELEVKQRLFVGDSLSLENRVAEDLTVLGTSNNLDILESYIREEMAAVGVSNPQESIIGYVTPEDESIDLIDVKMMS